MPVFLSDREVLNNTADGVYQLVKNALRGQSETALQVQAAINAEKAVEDDAAEGPAETGAATRSLLKTRDRLFNRVYETDKEIYYLQEKLGALLERRKHLEAEVADVDKALAVLQERAPA